MTLILPIAGSSSRYPGLRPKWMLTHPSGCLMLTESIRGINLANVDKILIIALEAHEKQYNFSEALVNEISIEYSYNRNKISLILLPNITKSQPETIYEGLIREKACGGILIKDCDNHFKLNMEKFPDYNFVSVVDIQTLKSIYASNKSYVKVGDNNNILNIVEKQVISNLFCCGGYYFENSEDFISSYKHLEKHENLYVSHIIYHLMLNNKHFFIEKTTNFYDWGTYEDWQNFRNKFKTLFLDIDGVIVENSGEHFFPTWGTTEGIIRNIEHINNLKNEGYTEIILTTCRKESYKEITIKQLDKIGLKYDRIIFGLKHNKRIIINDYSDSNPYPTCSAINIKRNTEDLTNLL